MSRILLALAALGVLGAIACYAIGVTYVWSTFMRY